MGRAWLNVSLPASCLPVPCKRYCLWFLACPQCLSAPNHLSPPPLDFLLPTLPTPHRSKPNQATFRVVVGALREAGELGEALRVYQAMRRLNYPADNAEFEGLTAAAGERG